MEVGVAMAMVVVAMKKVVVVVALVMRWQRQW